MNSKLLMIDRIAYEAEKIFTGTDILTNHAIIVRNNLVEDILPATSLPSNIKRIIYNEALITAPFIDIQIYGAEKKLFATYPNVDSLISLNNHCRKYGTTYCLPTVATNTYDVFFKAIDAIREYWNIGGKGVAGLHIEGPWLNKERRGAHVEELIFSPTINEVRELLEYGKEVIKMITLAPEVCSDEIIALINTYNIIISAGHSNTTYTQAIQSFDKGIDAVTHLYNAMSNLHHREPGLVGACFNHNRIRASIIPDGYHVDFAAISIAKKAMGERLFVITDAVTDTNEGYYHHRMTGNKYEANGVLSGSALTMNRAVFNLVNHVGITLDEALRMCNLYPAIVLKAEALGLIQKGYPARFVVLDEKFNVIDLID